MKRAKLDKLIQEIEVNEETHELSLPEELGIYLCEITGLKTIRGAVNRLLRERFAEFKERTEKVENKIKEENI